MKYLVTTKSASPIPLSPEERLAIWQAAKEWMSARLADGTIECHYVFADFGGFAIFNADSHEALLDTLMEYPPYSRFDWEVKALLDWGHVYDKLIESLQN